MFLVKNIVKNEIIIQKSRFITFLIPMEQVEDVSGMLENLRKEYKDATHYCYAYVINNQQKYDDDGEPLGTAGMPILDCLLKCNLTNVLCVVIRYFGGIKLGAGGLIRAYKKACKSTIDAADLCEYVEYTNLKLITNYTNENYLNMVCRDIEIISKSYLENITYVIKIPIQSKDAFIASLDPCITVINY